jgi:serine/threonine-protein kinase
MLAGVLPFRGDSMAELMYKIANEEAPDIRIIRPEISERLANIVALSLSKRPETRYQTGEEFAADLRAVMNEGAGGGAAPRAAVAASTAGAVSAAASEGTTGFEATMVAGTGTIAGVRGDRDQRRSGTDRRARQACRARP